MKIEDQLRETLRRRDPSIGFAERVAARAQPGSRENAPRFRWLQPRFYWLLPRFYWLWSGVAVASAGMALFAGVAAWQRAQEARAGSQAVLALRIASEKLNHTRSLVLRQTEDQ